MNYEIKFKIKYPIDFSKCTFDVIKKNQLYIFRSHKDLLNKEKEIIDTLDNNHMWDRIKKRSNPYELIYTTYNKRKNDSIADIQPLSRSYFKIIEINNKIPLIKTNKNIIICNLAEGPGGFMEALHHKYPDAKLIGLTLPPDNKFIPDWNKLNSTLNTDKIKVYYGNLYIFSDIKKFVKNMKYTKADLVTADGGFDYSSDFNGQEINSHKIIFSEIFVSLMILKNGGNLVCKIFDIFSVFTNQILKIVYTLFDKVIIYKPNTSRPANSEKYLVCLGYNNKIRLEDINKLLKKCLEIDNYYYLKNVRIENDLYKTVFEYNEIYIKHQIYHLKYTIKLINENQKYIAKDVLYKQIKKAIKWCEDNDVPINKKSIYYNMLSTKFIAS